MKSFGLICLMLLSLTGCGPSTVQTMPASTFSPPPASSQTITIAAASDLKFALGEVIAEFEKTHSSIKVEATFGSSGNFFSQLTNRAPFDMFLSADRSFPQKLIEQELAIKESEFPYAVGHIVMWVRNDSPLNVDEGLKLLTDPTVKKIAIANPKTAPYGRAAEAALKHSEIHSAVEERLVIGENIAQATQFVETGAADVGIIALSLALSPPLKDKGRYWTVPSDAYPKLEQAGVIMSWARDRSACEKFKAFLLSQAGRSILKRYGFE